MSKHTPGPWETKKKFDHQNHIEVQHKNLNTPGAASGVIARVTCRQTWLDEQTANAHLIAAAPELLEALQRAMSIIQCSTSDTTGEEYREYYEVRTMAFEAIAKALNKPITE